jgi:3',5'-cyclic AMP phosphodiesterase CpdA
LGIGKESVMFRLAHFSDPHIGPLPSVSFRDLASKRMVGYLNWRRSRMLAHDMPLLSRMIADIHAQHPDHIACTGDLVNIGLHSEFEPAARFLSEVGSPEHVSLVPGNHDAYVRSSQVSIDRFLGPWMQSESGRYEGFPYIRLKGPVALIGLSSALPTFALLATGTLGAAQRRRFSEVLDFLGNQKLARVVMIHHPPYRGGATLGRQLTDAAAFEDIIAQYGAELVLHGHNHAVSTTHLDGPRGTCVPVVGVPSISAIRGSKTHRAGYHIFDFEMKDTGISISAHARGLLDNDEIGFINPISL